MLDPIAALDRLFDEDIRQSRHFGAQLAVYRNGQLLYSRDGGTTGPRFNRPVGPDTPFMIFSVSKSIVAAAVHRLAGQGRLSVDKAVAEYWPQFGRNGKDKVTVRDLLTHHAGLQRPGTLADIVSWLQPSWMSRRIAAKSLVPGQYGRCVYHSFSAHVALGELVHRVSGRPVAEYLTEEFFRPLGLANTFAGLPADRFRNASGVHTADPAQNTPARVFSFALLRSAFLPAASVNTTALDLGRFYSMLAAGGRLDGREYISADALAAALQPAYDGPDGDTGRRIVWSQGWTLGGYSAWPDKDIRIFGKQSSQQTFGHAGQGGCALAWAEPDSGLIMVFVNNRFLELEASQRRAEEYSDAVRRAFG
ncbi:MAG: beta-lactamase family protein [Spirochaetes bacterium]|nr:beta-lactamase family protein [Spirochaetota bacterium]MBU0954060.1 beta-lactamase family protein [Spirochaetota bacterium]